MRLGVILAAGLVLAGCGSGRIEDLLIACPELSLPADTADLTRYRPDGPPDLSAMVMDARITAIEGSCVRGRRDRSVVARIAPRFQVERGPAAQGRAVELPWYLAVVEEGTERIASRATFRIPAAFPANTPRLTITSAPIEIEFPVAEGRRVQDYRIMVGFLLNEEELALNRRRGAR
ncbi:hypothetical protein [Rubritepida flocculans]|uniref:hypothetical protein n=1 Tax=Rubritepida flocculans TaxID=182403 RepID=UPI0004220228|nr:hypothetical protein [Rubritepida flocculans]